MSVHKYLDETGLALVWSKIRSALNLKANKSELSSVAISGTMSSLDDTNVSSPSDGQVLTYNSTNSKWINSDLPNDVMIVSYDGDSADKTFLEIYSHINNGGIAILIYLDCIYHLYSFSQYGIEFRLIDTADDSSEGIYATYSFCVHISNQNEVTYDEIWISSPKESTSTPLMNGTASVGVSYRYAHGDHVHPTDTSRAAVADVLTKTNTTSYTPTSDYHPATKKYVDDKSLMIVTITSSGSGDNTTYSADKTFNQIKTHLENKGMVLCLYGNDYYHIKYMYYEELYDDGSIIFESINGFYEQHVNAYAVSRVEITIYNDDYVEINRIESSLLNTDISLPTNGQILMYNSTTSNWENEDIPTDTTRAAVSDVLTKTNTTSYTPTANYHPATKKYVDDNIPTVPTKVSDLTNDSGFISSYTETDPIFTASAAHGITSSDITNWNSKTSLTLGTTSSTAFRGDYGNSAYTHAVTNKGSAFSSGLYKITTNSEGHVTGATAVVKADITGLGVPAQDTTYTFDGTYNASTNKAATVSTVTNAVSSKANSSDVLTKTNTTSYTPSADYNPATKKYVDDAISSNLMIITISRSSATYISDKTFNEIRSHVTNGGTVICKTNYYYDDNDDHVYHLVHNGSDYLVFAYFKQYLDYNTGQLWYDANQIIITNSNAITVNGVATGSYAAPSSTTPKALGTASVGTEYAFARGDHVHPLPTLSISGNTITLTGATGSTSSITLPVYNGGVSS